jgi:hypothetical protein
MYAFLSYQTADEQVAGEIRTLLEELGIKSFLAHEDIEVSQEWRLKILEEVGEVDLFIPILSANYYSSKWCVQESGIAAFRRLTIIPLSIDGTIPEGFIAHVQSTKVEPGKVTLGSIFPGLAKKDSAFVIDSILQIIKKSGSYRGAEANFQMILPYVGKATDEQMRYLLQISLANGQVLHASQVAREFLPPIMKSHGHLLDPETREEIECVLAQYS